MDIRAEAKRLKRTFKEESKKSRESENDSEVYTVLMLVLVDSWLTGKKSTSELSGPPCQCY